MTTLLFFIVALGILIFVHEFGHFIVAKRQRVKVETFSLGFGPRLIGFRRGDTDYRISLFPLGGYVKMLGEDPSEPGSDDPRSFSKKGVWQRVKIVLFGPLMNLGLSLILMPIVFMIGRPQPAYLDQVPTVMAVRAESPAAEAGFATGDTIITIDGDEVTSWESVMNAVLLAKPGTVMGVEVDRDGQRHTLMPVVGKMPEMQGGYLGVEPMLFLGNEAVIDGLAPGGPADEAGLKKGDTVLAFNGKPVLDWLDLTQKVNANEGEPASITVARADGSRQNVEIVPAYSEEYGRWLIGIRKDRTSGVPMVTKQYGFFSALVKGTQENAKLFMLTLTVLKRLVTFQLSYKVLGGPIIIAKTSAAAASSGLAPFIFFLAFLSMQLCILNLLPIPILDGGHMVFLGIEAVRRRPVSVRAREIAAQVGFVVLISLMLLVTINDIDHVWGIRNLLEKIF